MSWGVRIIELPRMPLVISYNAKDDRGCDDGYNVVAKKNELPDARRERESITRPHK